MKPYRNKFLITCGFALSIPCFVFAQVKSPQWENFQLPNSPSLRGSAVIDNTLWVTGSNNAVFVSQDQGKTWSNKSVPISNKGEKATDFRDVELFDKHTAIVMGVGTGKDSRLYKTIDGGNNWHLLYQNEDEQGFFDSIAFWDKENGLLMGDPVDGFYMVKRTFDGGKTWQRIAKAKLPVITEKEAAFAASGNTLIAGKKGQAWLTTGGFSASVYHSSDYGQSWQRATVPLFNSTQTAGGYGLALNSQEQVFVVGGDYQQRNASYANMATLKDNQWQLSQSGEHGLRTAMSCQGSICIATGKNASDISYDSGITWQVLDNKTAKINDKGFYTLASDNGLFLGAGTDGKVAVLSLNKEP